MGGRGTSSISALFAMARGENNGEDSEKLLNAPWQRYESGNQVSVGATLEQAENRIKSNNYETGILIDEDGFVVAAYKGGHSSVNFGNEPASKFENAVITHNHPSGSAFFSVADLAAPAAYTALGGKPRGIRAVTRDNGTVSIVATRQDADWNRLATAYNKAQRSIRKDWIAHGDVSSYASASSYFQKWLFEHAPKYGFRFTVER